MKSASHAPLSKGLNFSEEIAMANLRRMWWLLITSTSLSLVLAVINALVTRDHEVMPWQMLDLGGSVVFFVLIAVGLQRRLPLRLTWLLSPAYFAFWLILMDGYYFSAMLQFGETITYALGMIAPAVLILLPPRWFLSLLLCNHALYTGILVYLVSSQHRTADQISGSFVNGTLGVIIAILGAWHLYQSKKAELTKERLVTERTREIESAELHLRTILENIPFRAWLRDTNHRFLAANSEFARFQGVPVEQLIGKTLYEIEPSERARRIMAEDEEIMRRGERIFFERETEDGSRWNEIFKTPVISPEGVCLGTAGLVRDVTSRKEVEEELRAANDAKSEFLAIMSHEIRTPMNSVLGYAQLLKDLPLTTLQREYVDSINNSGQLLLTVINDILDFSKIEAGKIVLAEEPMRLHDLLTRLLSMFEPLAAQKGLRLGVTIGDGVPACIVGDLHRIEQLLVNLLSNAVKFTAQGTVDLRVEKIGETGDIVLLKMEVQDTGIGITPEDSERLFQPFSQVDTAMARRFSGTGLGLVIAQRLSELMGGMISLVSKPGEGSTFTATLRVKRSDESGVETKTRPVAMDTDLSTRRVLVVEDNASNRRLMDAILRRWNLEAKLTESGIEALEELQKNPYDVVLMDVQMPGMDGLEATRRIRDWESSRGGRRHYIIALTALAMADDSARCFNAGMDDYLTKPVSPKALREAIGRAGSRFEA